MRSVISLCEKSTYQNMSGNTVAVAIHLSKRNWSDAWAHACPILAFFPGLIAGDCIVEISKRFRLAAALMPALLVEAAGLSLFLFLHKTRFVQPGPFHMGYDADYGPYRYCLRPPKCVQRA
jgi:uncharacterized membrane protein YoaK (UPF0700 family)